MKVEAGAPLLALLRAATAKAHEALEQDLAFLAQGHDRGLILAALQRFHGFHYVWEPAISASPVGRFAAQRGRLGHVAADLFALGLTSADLAALPRCEASGELAATKAASLGSLYVMEGSSLGGQIINRALREASWAPPGGLRYFNPHGKATAAKWREFLAWMAAEAQGEDHRAIAHGALRTFEVLRRWLPTMPVPACLEA